MESTRPTRALLRSLDALTVLYLRDRQETHRT